MEQRGGNVPAVTFDDVNGHASKEIGFTASPTIPKNKLSRSGPTQFFPGFLHDQLFRHFQSPLITHCPGPSSSSWITLISRAPFNTDKKRHEFKQAALAHFALQTGKVRQGMHGRQFFVPGKPEGSSGPSGGDHTVKCDCY